MFGILVVVQFEKGAERSFLTVYSGCSSGGKARCAAPVRDFGVKGLEEVSEAELVGRRPRLRVG